MMERMETALVLLGEELGFVGGHVHRDRALGLAGFATEAKVEGLVNSLALEAFGAQRSGEHLPQKAGAAAGGVLLVAGGAIAGAHDATFGLETCADADAARGGALQRALVAEQNEVGLKLGVLVRALSGLDWAMAEILDWVVNTGRIDELAGVHAVVGIPDGLELAESFDELGAEHLGQQRGAGLAIAMLTGE